MSYHSFSECTLTADERFHEKNEIIKLLEQHLEPYIFSEKEWSFIDKMKHTAFVSVRQLFWLRDIKDKYL